MLYRKKASLSLSNAYYLCQCYSNKQQLKEVYTLQVRSAILGLFGNHFMVINF